VARAAFAVTSFRFVVVRGDEVVGIFRSADTHSVIARAGCSQARVGISTTCRGISEVARGYWEAVRAIRFTSDQDPCVDLSRVGPLRYLEFNADSVARQLAAQYLGPLRQGTTLADTLLVYVECGLNARSTAERLGVHLNTVHNRLERVAELLQRPRLAPLDFVEAATAIRICRDDASRGMR
jgi:DNA-binding PucR family transcriptional regulator